MSNVAITILGISFIFLMTTLGATLVYFINAKSNENLNTLFLGFASGVMIAASIWSLIIPSLDLASAWGKLKFIPALVGIILGGLFLVLIDRLTPQSDYTRDKNVKKSTKLFLAVTIHNIPEGLAVGFSFGAASIIGTNAAFWSALGLAIGIGIQNFPEGSAVALPIQSSTGSKNKGFLFGMLSGAVEPVFAVIGYFLAAKIQFIQPWLLAFAAGSMIFVVAEDLIPDSHIEKHPHLGTWGVMLGFIMMMVLDVALG